MLVQVQHSKTSAAVRSATSDIGVAGGGTLQCRNVTSDEVCYSHVVWAMRAGILQRPDWYPGLTPLSTWNEFQQALHDKGGHGCPEPCASEELPPDVIFQEGAWIPEGGEVRLYVIGTSNVLWESWPDQLHAMLKRLGYVIPAQDFSLASVKQPTDAPTCDDASEFSQLDTPRIGRLGWSSWGFAHDSEDDCGESGFRDILGHKVSCINAWACNPAWRGTGGAIRPSEVAMEAQQSNVVVISNWINDGKQRYSQYRCFDGEEIDALASTELTVVSLRALVRAIHAHNPSARVFIMALYPDATGLHINEHILPRIASMNAAVESGVALSEPNTFFVNYDFPPGEDMYQVMHGGHPNCRGDRVMATAVLEALFQARVVSKAFALEDPELCLNRGACGALTLACCRRSALCYVGADSSCLPYGPGQQ